MGTCFLSLADFCKEYPDEVVDNDPQYWEEGWGMILKVEILTVVPGGYKIEEEE